MMSLTLPFAFTSRVECILAGSVPALCDDRHEMIDLAAVLVRPGLLG